MRKRSEHKKIVYWSNEDNTYIGMCPTLFFGGVHGESQVEVFKHLLQVVKEVEQMKRRPLKKKRR